MTVLNVLSQRTEQVIPETQCQRFVTNSRTNKQAQQEVRDRFLWLSRLAFLFSEFLSLHVHDNYSLSYMFSARLRYSPFRFIQATILPLCGVPSKTVLYPMEESTSVFKVTFFCVMKKVMSANSELSMLSKFLFITQECTNGQIMSLQKLCRRQTWTAVDNMKAKWW